MSEKTRISRSASSTVRPLAAGLVTDVPEHGSGRFVVAPGTSDTVGSGTLATYTVEVEEDLDFDVAEVARHIEAVLADDRGWTALMPAALQRVPADPVFRILIATPETADALCAPLDTGGRLSCRNGANVVLNAWRWVNGAQAYDGNLLGYRRYMVNHEVGHALGNAHASCPEAGATAPVMLQQTKGLDGCRPNPWPVTASTP